MANNNQTNEDYLIKIGSNVRSLRASRGMTRKMLARDSSVSERYLANLEQGQGNISINLLRQVANALHTQPAKLLPTTDKLSPEQSLINEFLTRLSRDDQQTALKMLYQRFSSVDSYQTRIALIGMRGAGKTTLGKLLKERQNLHFVKLVDVIESIGGMSVPEILELSGQSGYRRLEEDALFRTLNDHHSCCIEAGGSIVSEANELNILLTSCLVIWVKTSPQEHMDRVIAQGDFRPMADNKYAMNDLESILIERTPYYEQAHAILDTTSKTIDQSYDDLLQIIQDKSNLDEELSS
ncbi:MAG: helix-turn-helix transcriptional regulator [Gammaproteobacteria bacterium]|nr:helix-turn-helix transcriptional regulator [Gammaproteobacteria bacterium]